MAEIHNPWREFIENCINGRNYFRSSEYMDLLADLDRGYAAEALLRDIYSYAEDQGMETLMDMIDTADSATHRESV